MPQPSAALRNPRIPKPKGIAIRSAASGSASMLAAIALAYLIWDGLKGFLGDPLIALMLVLLLIMMIIPVIYERKA